MRKDHFRKMKSKLLYLCIYTYIWLRHLLYSGGLSIIAVVISYIFPSEYFISPFSELSFCKRAVSVVWKSLAYSFISLWQRSLSSESLDIGQHPTAGTPTMANFLAPRLNKFCHNQPEFQFKYEILRAVFGNTSNNLCDYHDKERMKYSYTPFDKMAEFV